MNSITPGFRVGVLGGGQLAQMLVTEGLKMGLEMHVLSKSASDPAALVTRHWHQGDPDDVKTASEFFKSVDVVTIESEFTNGATITAAESSSGTKIYPKAQMLGELSDRLSQKNWLKKNKISTADFVEIKTLTDVATFFKDQKQIVIKKRRFGYDGYGTFVIRTGRDFEAWQALHANSCHDFIAESFVPFRRELALQMAMNERGQVMTFPLVEWQAQDSKCLWVKGPMNLPKKLAAELSRLQKQAALGLKKSQYVGLVTFELFETGSKLLVNEMAPRVHNSGHYSLEAMPTNQFSAHLRAILNLPLPKEPTLTAGGFAMWNLIGTKNEPASKISLPQPTDCTLHWYGKTEIRKGRKVGHITAVAKTADQALKIVKAQAKGFRI